MKSPPVSIKTSPETLPLAAASTSPSEPNASAMKTLREGADRITSQLAFRVSVLAVTAIVSFYIGTRWSDAGAPLAFYSDSATANPSSPSAVAVSPNANLSIDVSSLIGASNDGDVALPPSRIDVASEADLERSARPPPPPPPVSPQRVGIVDENGTMSVDFETADFSPDLEDTVDDEVPRNETLKGEESGDEAEIKTGVKIGKFDVCPESMREYIPCMDNEEEIRNLKSTERGERFERHCPAKGEGLDCLVPKPIDYRTPIPWPQSRDEVWFSNVPHTRLVDDKGGQNWISKVGDKFVFPGGGTQFIHGANQYLDQISEMVPDIAFGNRTRIALDIGCGVASFGAFLLSRGVLTMSIAPKDVHENQIQFALERGVPAMVAAVATNRLPYPSQAFDLIHCSRCRINWTRDDGILLLEVNRLLRAGGYFVWAAQPVYKHEEAQQEAWKEMENLTARLCWQFVKKEGYIAIWQKPSDNSCYTARDPVVQPLLCDPEDEPNDVWYTKLKPCISRLPENGYAANITTWPGRLNEPPQRLQEVEMDSYMAKNELFKAETQYWSDVIGIYSRVFRWKQMNARNIMDMRAGFGGFAAALINQQFDCWVMNVVPLSGPNTLPVIYDRGLIGVMHDWCEPFDTYPRTYDLLHASGLFSKERKRCNISSILLEMDRILRPGGRAYIRDSKYVLKEIQEITRAMGWRTDLRDTAEGPYASRKVLHCDKPI